MKTQKHHARKNHWKSLLAAGLAAAAVANPREANASLIVNGSFELPDVPAGSTFVTGTPTGWSASAGTVIYTMDSSGGPLGGLPDAQEGGQYVVMTANTGWSLYQDFALAGGTYKLTWHANSSPGYSTHYLMSLTGPDSTGPTDYSVTGGAWTEETLTLDLSAGNYTFAFSTSNLGAAAPFWDNVSLDLVSSTSVPDAGGTASLLGAAIGGLATLRRRR